MPVKNINPLSYGQHNITTMFLASVTPEVCLSKMYKLKLTKQHENSLPINLFQYVSPHVYDVCDMINYSFSIAVFPDMFECATNTPVFKSCCSEIVSNHRPISVLSFFRKICEKCIHKCLFNFVISNSLISP